jgi:hypothetical protein
MDESTPRVARNEERALIWESVGGGGVVWVVVVLDCIVVDDD